MQAGITQFVTDFPQIIGTLKTLAPQAQLIVLNLYNPFNSLDPLYTVFDPHSTTVGHTAIYQSILDAGQKTSGVTLLAGLTRVDTALEIAKASYTGKFTNVILATADNYPDTLAGNVFAYKLKAPYS